MINVQPCSYDAARYAVMNWHYSKAMPASSLVKYGVWEDGEFIGAVIFSRGSTITYAKSLGVGPFEVCELVRVALCGHRAPVTEIVARCIRMLKSANPGLRIILSFADIDQGHHGGIYIAGNWIYLGRSTAHHNAPILANGRLIHARTVSDILRKNGGSRSGESVLDAVRRILGDPDAHRPSVLGKHRYVYPLDRATRRRFSSRALPYPVPCERGIDGDTPGHRPGSPGPTPGVRSVHGRSAISRPNENR